jgi:phosphoglycerate dehydrogenase-like enzyme
LQQGRIGGAALDVFEEEPLPATSPLWDLSSVIVTPHMAGLTDRMWERVADIFTENYSNYLADDELLNTIE